MHSDAALRYQCLHSCDPSSLIPLHFFACLATPYKCKACEQCTEVSCFNRMSLSVNHFTHGTDDMSLTLPVPARAKVSKEARLKDSVRLSCASCAPFFGHSWALAGIILSLVSAVPGGV
eukprot:s571_g18.t1